MIAREDTSLPISKEDSLKSSYQLCKKDNTKTYLSARLANSSAPSGAQSPDPGGGSTNSPPHRPGKSPANAIGKALTVIQADTLNEKTEDRKVTVNCDWIQGTAEYYSRSRINQLRRFIENSFNVKLVINPGHYHNGMTYDHVGICPITETRISYIKDRDTGTYKVGFSIPGRAIRPVHPVVWLTVIVRAVVNFNVKMTRLDGAADDYVRRVKISKILELAQKGDCAKVRRYLYMISGDIGQVDGTDSIYLGSNRRLLNIYNAEYMHGKDAERWEGRFREKRAEHLAQYFVDHFDPDSDVPLNDQINDCLRYLGNYVLKIVDFVKREGDKTRELKRYRRYKFYYSLLKDIGEVDIDKLPKQESINAAEFVQKTFDWGNKQVFKRFALMSVAFSFDFDYLFRHCLAAASIRFTAKDILWLEEIQNFIDNNFVDTGQIREYFDNYLIPTVPT